MQITTKFEIGDIVLFDGRELRVYEINIALDELEPNGFIEYILFEPLDCDDRDDYYRLNHHRIEEATLVRPAAEENQRLIELGF